MKKTLIIGFIFIILGFITGRILYDKVSDSQFVFKNTNNTYYFLQEGVYSNEDIMNENTKKISNKLITKSDNKYYVYLGITKNIDIAKKIEKIYDDKNIDIYYKEIFINNEEFSNNVDQFDNLINSTNNLDDILTIEEVVLSNYQEIMEKDK